MYSACSSGVRLDPRLFLFSSLEQIAARLAPDGPASGGDPRPDRAGHAREMSAMFFGDPEAPLFGIHHAPRHEQGDLAVLVCNPIGREYTHSHWAIRGLARLAAREGLHVFRFDYTGTGDSWGRLEDASLSRWSEDVATAAREARRLSGAPRLAVVGLRVGAAIATVSQTNGLDADQLVLWDPVVDGADYVRSQHEIHRWVIDVARGGRSSGSGATRPGAAPDEGPLPRELEDDLARLDLLQAEPVRVPTWIVASSPDPRYTALAERGGPEARLEIVDDAGEWNDPEASQMLLLVKKIPAHIAALLRGSP